MYYYYFLVLKTKRVRGNQPVAKNSRLLGLRKAFAIDFDETRPAVGSIWSTFNFENADQLAYSSNFIFFLSLVKK